MEYKCGIIEIEETNGEVKINKFLGESIEEIRREGYITKTDNKCFKIKKTGEIGYSEGCEKGEEDKYPIVILEPEEEIYMWYAPYKQELIVAYPRYDYTFKGRRSHELFKSIEDIRENLDNFEIGKGKYYITIKEKEKEDEYEVIIKEDKREIYKKKIKGKNIKEILKEIKEDIKERIKKIAQTIEEKSEREKEK